MAKPPILLNKQYTHPSVFTPENLLREARRQKSLTQTPVPQICVLDPDGDIVRWLVNNGSGELNNEWACYHTDLYTFTHNGTCFGIIGCAVGASFAVLVAEELFASGCKLLISVTSAGQISRISDPPYFVLIEKALRDEGTSYHYLPPSDFAHIEPGILLAINDIFIQPAIKVHKGATWTTDAPFRETAGAIEYCRKQGILAVEMEAAALYAFAQLKHKPVVCLAHVTNQMASVEGDFEKGAANGSQDALQVVDLIARAWLSHQTTKELSS